MRKYTIILVFGVLLGLYLRNILDEKPASAKIITVRSRNLEYQVETKDDKLTHGMVVSIIKPVTVSILDGGNPPFIVATTAEIVDDLLREQKIGLAATDRVTPDVNSYLAENLTIKIDRIVDLEITEEKDIPFAVNIEHDPSSYYGREEVVRAGELGKKEQNFLITYKNGIEVKRRLLSEKVLQAPVPEHRRLGTRIEVEQTQEGRASWYAYKDCLCAAHPLYEKGRFVRVTAINSGKTIIVKINDRGPDLAIHPDRVIDLDATAYKQLAGLGSGTIGVKVELLR